MSDVFYYRYVLKSSKALNARSQREEFEGCLIRVEQGVGCIHPWPELGDETLDEQLEALKNKKPHRLGERALQCARLDGEARNSGVSLFDGLTIPDSHLTVLSGMDMDKKKAKLFSHIKLKGQTDLVKVKEDALRCLALASPGCRLRIDFNESLDHSVAMNLVQALGEDVCECIEFIEDPMRFDFENWSQLRRQIGLPLAVDRECEAAIAVDAEVDYLIIKPAVVNTSGLITKLAESEKPPQLVVTSYMDHAVGQMFAAYEAALLKAKYPDRVQQCGLLTHKLFESDEFFGAIKSLGPKLMIPGGTGLGFDEQLEDLAWEKLE